MLITTNLKKYLLKIFKKPLYFDLNNVIDEKNRVYEKTSSNYLFWVGIMDKILITGATGFIGLI